MNRHSEIAPLNTSFVHSTLFPSPPANGGTESGKRGGMSPPRRSSPPSLPPSSQIPTTRQPTWLENFNPGPRISGQSISQPSPAPAFSICSWAEMSPAPSSIQDTPTSAPFSAALPPLPFRRPNASGTSSSALPPRKIHRRANSDSVSSINPVRPHGGMRPIYPRPVEMPVGAKKSKEGPGEEDGANAYKDVIDNILNMSSEEGGDRMSGDSENGKNSGSENVRKAISGVKRSRRAGKDIAPSSSAIHSRSFSVDSNLNGNSSSIGGELPPSPGNLQGVTNSVDGNENAYQTDFTASELQSITCSKRLKPLTIVNDPERVQRILANRKAAARSKERKAQYLLDLERKVVALKTEISAITAHTKFVEETRLKLEDENTLLRVRVEGLTERARIREEFIAYLTGEVTRLKNTTGQVIPNSNLYGRSNWQSVDADMLQQLNLNQSHQQGS